MEAFKHKSVLLEEAVLGLNIKPDGIYVDCTLGAGGHSAAILQQLKTGFLYAFDQDQNAIAAAAERLKDIGSNYVLIKSNFVNLEAQLKERGVSAVDGVLFDLGVSSPQFDNPGRGFSYNYDAPLDMRMDQTQALSAYEVVNTYSFNDLYRIITRYGEEMFAKAIARAIERERANAPIKTTFELSEIIKSAIPAKFRRDKHPAKKTFQAIRIEVNKELEVLPAAIEAAVRMLKVEGRLSVITFHSLEDKIVKDILKKYSQTPEIPRGLPVLNTEEPMLKLINHKVITAGEEELSENNRAHSAKLRIAEKKRERI